jgi:hypothetical protein
VEYLDFRLDSDFKEKRRILIDIEQKYLDLFAPGLNTNKFAGSMRGFKHSEKTIKN